MKRIKTLMLLMVVALTAVSLQSCDDDDDDYYPAFNLATVTLKAPKVDGGKWFMQLDDSTTLEATNIASHPYDNRELRAYIRYNDIKDMTSAPASTSAIQKMYSVNVLTIDTILEDGSHGGKYSRGIWQRPGGGGKQLGDSGRGRIYEHPLPHPFRI